MDPEYDRRLDLSPPGCAVRHWLDQWHVNDGVSARMILARRRLVEMVVGVAHRDR